MVHRLKILYTIPNFDTAGSGIHLFSILGDNEKIRFKNSDLFIDPINVYSRH